MIYLQLLTNYQELGVMGNAPKWQSDVFVVQHWGYCFISFFFSFVLCVCICFVFSGCLLNYSMLYWGHIRDGSYLGQLSFGNWKHFKHTNNEQLQTVYLQKCFKFTPISSTSTDQAAMETNNSFLSHTKPFEYTKRHWELNPSTRGQPASFVWLLDITLQSVNI